MSQSECVNQTEQIPSLVIDVTPSLYWNEMWGEVQRYELAVARSIIQQAGCGIQFVAWHDPSRRFVPLDYSSVVLGDWISAVGRAGRLSRQEFTIPSGGNFLCGYGSWVHTQAHSAAIADFAYNHSLTIYSTIHDLAPIEFPQWFGKCRAEIVRSNLIGLIRQSRGIFVPSDQVRSELNEFAEASNLTPPPTTIVGVGDDERSVRLDVSSITVPQLKQRFAPGSFALFVGTLNFRNNAQILYHAWQRILSESQSHSPHLVIVTDVCDKADELGHAFALTPSLSGTVSILHDIDNDGLLWLQQNCLLTLHPEFYNGFALAAQRSASLGKNAVCSTAYAKHRLLHDNTRLIDPLDVCGWAAEIGQIGERQSNPDSVIGSPDSHTWDNVAQAIIAGIQSAGAFSFNANGVKLDEICAMGRDSTKSIYLKGWGHRDEDIVWSQSGSPAIRIDLDFDYSDKLWIIIKARCQLGMADPHFIVSANGSEVLDCKFPNEDPQIFAFEVQNENPDGSNCVEMQFLISEASGTTASSRAPFRIGLHAIIVTDDLSRWFRSNHSGFIADCPNTLLLGQTQNAQSRESAKALLGSDAALSGAWGAYTTSSPLTISVQLPEPLADADSFALQFRAVATPDDPQIVQVVAGDRVVAIVHCHDSSLQRVTFEVPRIGTVRQSLLTISLNGIERRSPRSLGVGHEPEAIGIGVFSLERISPISAVVSEHSNYELGAIIDLRKGTDLASECSSKYLESLWYVPESDGRWAVGESANFCVALHPDKKEFDLQVEVVLAVPGEIFYTAPWPILRLLVNGVEVAREKRSTPGFQSFSGIVPSRVVEKGSGSLSICVATDRSIVPYQTNSLIRDDRVLGIMVRSLIIGRTVASVEAVMAGESADSTPDYA